MAEPTELRDDKLEIDLGADDNKETKESTGNAIKVESEKGPISKNNDKDSTEENQKSPAVSVPNGTNQEVMAKEKETVQEKSIEKKVGIENKTDSSKEKNQVDVNEACKNILALIKDAVNEKATSANDQKTKSYESKRGSPSNQTSLTPVTQPRDNKMLSDSNTMIKLPGFPNVTIKQEPVDNVDDTAHIPPNALLTEVNPAELQDIRHILPPMTIPSRGPGIRHR